MATARTLLMGTTIQEVAQAMQAGNVDAVLLTHPDEEVVGIVTARDLAKRALAEGVEAQSPAHRFMTAPVHSIPASASRGVCVADAATRRGASALADSDLAPRRDLLNCHQNALPLVLSRVAIASSTTELRACRDRGSNHGPGRQRHGRGHHPAEFAGG